MSDSSEGIEFTITLRGPVAKGNTIPVTILVEAVG